MIGRNSAEYIALGLDKRTTAEMITDLNRRWAGDHDDALSAEAADRLAELDAEVAACQEALEAQAAIGADLARVAFDALRPPCPTCGGKGTSEPYFAGSTLGYVSHVCPDCVDGKVSIEQLVARWNAVQSLSPSTRILAVFDAERSVKP